MPDLAKVNLDQPSDDPSQARAELEALLDRVNDLASTATDDGTKGFNLVSIPPPSYDNGITKYQFRVGDIRRYGALVNGIADDQPAITLALNSNRGEIFIPAGHTRITKEIDNGFTGGEPYASYNYSFNYLCNRYCCTQSDDFKPICYSM